MYEIVFFFLNISFRGKQMQLKVASKFSHANMKILNAKKGQSNTFQFVLPINYRIFSKTLKPSELKF